MLKAALLDKLDAPTKSFEVAFRSHVVNKILGKYTSENALKYVLAKRIQNLKDSSIMMSGRIVSVISRLLKEKQWGNFWESLEFVKKCYMEQKQTESHDVMYLSETIHLTYIFPELFLDLTNAFSSVPEYMAYSQSFYEVRNALSHRGSEKITEEKAELAVKFMRIAGVTIPHQSFWYKNWTAILSELDTFDAEVHAQSVDAYGLRHENLDKIPVLENKIVCREPEILELFKRVCGWDGEKRMRNFKHCVCVCGYGGVGKTVLVVEFISRLLEYLKQDDYKGLRPEFILFYTAKNQSLGYNPQSGELRISREVRQIECFEDLRNKLHNDLNITDFDDDFKESGLLILDNLETLSAQDRDQILEYIEREVPSSVHVIITTRIPEEDTSQIPLNGFQKDAGQRFVSEYISRNKMKIRLSQQQIAQLVEKSNGNTLVLVLALKRIEANKASYAGVLRELSKLPKNTQDNLISSFMYQCTVEDLLRRFPDKEHAILDILSYFMIYNQGLNAEMIAIASKSLNVDQVREVLGILARYLVVERIGDSYVLNEFAQNYVLVKHPLDESTRAKREQEIISAVNIIKNEQKTLDEYCQTYPLLNDIIQEWGGSSEADSITIAKAFVLYEYKNQMRPGKCDYVIEQMDQEFDKLAQHNSTHPYVFYQRARILNELRIDGYISDKYNASIEEYFDRCFMAIDYPAFSYIKKTKTFPSIQWIFAQFLLHIKNYVKAASYAESSVQYFRIIDYRNDEYLDALAVYGITMVHMYQSNNIDASYINKARDALKELNKRKMLPANAKVHKAKLKEMLDKIT